MLPAELMPRTVMAGRNGGDLVTVTAPWERLDAKIQPWLLDRLAVVHVRQSIPQQILDHAESTRLQYGLTQRAVDLGWAPSQVLVIVEDLGHSASGLVDRPGFQRLVSEVGQGPGHVSTRSAWPVWTSAGREAAPASSPLDR
ncbi:hypothetical protein [Streptomyces kunmingensis]|uniref:hypothetical protein n=1 Tax=Streptomyces kunmingensis TaxID=68225 RepID=UPI0031D9527D